MEHLTIGVFHDTDIAKELGKKGTESDIRMYNKKTDDMVYSFMEPVEDKIIPKAQIIGSIDAAVLSMENMGPSVGETILMLDHFGVSKGILIPPPFSDPEQIKGLVKDTCLNDYDIMEKDTKVIMSWLEKLKIDRSALQDLPVVVSVDHSFSVKGVGEVILGLVDQGTVRKHDKLELLPIGKEVVVRSIQMQDRDFNEAGPGCRVGLAIKNATAEEMRRGSLFSPPGTVAATDKLELDFKKSGFYTKELQDVMCHLISGMAHSSGKVSSASGNNLSIALDKSIALIPGRKSIILDLNAPKSRVIGSGIFQVFQ